MKYEVLTWDGEKNDFTPQPGVRRGPYTKWGLRRALRKLQDMGYETSKAGGFSVLVYNRDTHAMVRKAPATEPQEKQG